MDKTDHYVNKHQLAERFGMQAQTLRKWRATGQGPAYVKVGRLVRYRVADVEAWIVTRTVAAAG